MPHPYPKDLGELEKIIAARDKKVRFSQTCMEARGPPDIRILDAANHPPAPLVNRTATHGAPITIPKRITKGEREKYLRYGVDASTA